VYAGRRLHVEIEKKEDQRTRNWLQLIQARRKEMIKEHDRVVLTKAIAEEGLEAGDVGTVVHLYGDGKAYEVEFVALNGHTVAVATVNASNVRPVMASEIPHARELVAA
jgi:hypothetical protein